MLVDVALWSNVLVFSNIITKKDIYERCPEISKVKSEIIPQGKCKKIARPGRHAKIVSKQDANNEVNKFLDNLREEEILVLAAGEIQPRKGVDIFIAVARLIKDNCREMKIKFVWIGSGYDPENDFMVSIWIEDQIKKCNLTNDLVMLDHSPGYERLIKRSDIFLITSRLDPLPNVGIDAMYEYKPVFCFDKACGLANMLKTVKELESSLVVDYYDINMMAHKASELINKKEKRDHISKIIGNNAKKWFNMDQYVDKLENIGDKQYQLEVGINREVKKLCEMKSMFDSTYLGTKRKSVTRWDIQKYILGWKTGIKERKPIKGFHPGIYKEEIMSKKDMTDPYIHYITITSQREDGAAI